MKTCRTLIAVGLGLVALQACDGRPTNSITRTRDAVSMRQLDASLALRLGFTKSASPHRGMEAGSSPRSAEQGIAEMLRYKVPDGWELLGPKPFRIVNLQAGDAECYVTYVAGGGASGNINRWRGQMGADPLDNAGIAKLQTSRILNRPAHLVDLEGAYRGMQAKAREGMRMRAIYVQFPAFALSIKMVGPKAAAEAQTKKFDAFCVSLSFAAQAAPPASSAAPNANGRFNPSKLRWSAPAGWREERGSGMRFVTFRVGEQAECYILFLPQHGGGLAANMNRWRRQMQQPPLDRAGIAALPRARILDVQQPFLEVFSESGQGILAVSSPVPGQTLFVKLIGTAGEVQAHKEGFLQFCSSLRIEP